MVNDAKLGARSNETSGVAISARKAQSDVSNYNYIDNRDRAIRHVGRQLINLIPTVYSERTLMRIVNDDDSSDMVHVINDPSQKAYSEEKINETDIKKIYNLGVGLYDVAIEAGQSYRSKRQEGAEILVKLANSWPDLLKIAGDVIFEDLDIPGAKKISKRLYSALPSELKPEEGQQSIPPAVAQQFKVMQQSMEAITEKNKQLEMIIQNKVVEKQAELEMKDKDIESRNQQVALKARTDEAAIQEKWMEARLKAMQNAQQAELDRRFNGIEAMLAGIIQSHQSQQEHMQQLEQISAQPKPTTTA
jgi:hypothetical protein